MTKHHPASSTEIFGFISDRFLRALREASVNLTRLEIPHVICGGVAVGAYGHVRATKDVDFLVDDRAFVKHGSIISLAPGVSFAVDGIPTDMIPIGDMHFLSSELEEPYELDGLPLISPEALVAMKLVAHRRRDVDDVHQLIEAGATTVERVRSYLIRSKRPDLLDFLTRAMEG